MQASDPSVPPPLEAARKVKRLLAGAWVAQAVFVAAKLGVADLLRDDPRGAADLAAACGANAGALHRVLRALSSIGVFALEEDGRFALTPLAEPLRADVPGSLRAYALMNGGHLVWRSWGEIEHSVRTGRPAFEHVFGAPLFDWLAANPEERRVGTEALRALSAADDAAILDVYDFPAEGVVADIGGGQGSLLAAILSTHPGLRGVLLDTTRVIELARPGIAAARLNDRCSLLVGNFFEAVPTGADICILKKVLHDWDDDRALAILRRCRDAMHDGARLLVAEMVIPPANTPSEVQWLDLLMLVYAGGRERTVEEHAALLAAAGFGLERVLPTASGITLLEASPGRA